MKTIQDMTLREAQDGYQGILNEIDEKRSPFDGGKKVMPPEAEEEVDRMFSEADEYQTHITALKKEETYEARLKKHREWSETPVETEASRAVASGEGVASETKRKSKVEEEEELKRKHDLQTEGFKSWMRRGSEYMLAGEAEEEFKALQADSDPRGGFVVAPKVVTQGIIEEVDDMVYLRSLATRHTIERGQSLGAPTRENDVSDPSWTSELRTGTLDNTEPFGMRDMNPYPLAKRITISNKLLDAPGFDIESYWRGRLAYKFAITLENAMMTGSGTNQPLGIFTASDVGIPTSRDVSAGATDDLTADALFDVRYFLKMQYWPRAMWMFSREGIKRVRKLKDAENQYLWQPGLQMGEPDRLLDHPVLMSEFCPDTFTTGNYIGMFGDYSHIWVVDSLTMETQRLVELYAERNLTGFIARMESDAQPTLPEAFARIKLD